MIKNWVGEITTNNTWGGLSKSALLPVAMTAIALLLGEIIGLFGTYAYIIIIGASLMAILILLRRDEIAAAVVLAVHLYVDWYLGLAFVAQIMTVVLLLAFYLFRSPRHPWAELRAPWLWGLFVVAAIFPATHGINALDSAYYYFNVIFSALLMLWLGTIIATDTAGVRRLFNSLAFFGSLIALHTIIEATTGTFLFKSSRYDAALQALSNFQLYGTGVIRAEGFLLNPDTNGTFLAIMFFLPLGLFVESSSLPKKIFYLGEMFLVLMALLFTYSTGAWLAALAGVITFIIFAGRNRYRLLIPVVIISAVLALIYYFPAQIDAQIRHAGAADEVPLRIAAWQTAIHVISTIPFTGLGLGRYVYMLRADPYRVPGQFIPLYQPQNAYLEIAALGGIQISLIFISLLFLFLWQAFQNWHRAAIPARGLLGAGIAAVVGLSINSLAVAGWTCGPIGAAAWLILGVVSSSLLSKHANFELETHV